MEQQRSVFVTRLDGDLDGMLRMTWRKHPSRTDTIEAFKVIHLHLRQATSPVHIIVDIRNNPVFPLAVTLNSAMQQQSHRQMGHWLVIGINPMARLIARTLSTIVANNIEWYESEAEVYQRLSILIQQHNDITRLDQLS